MTGITRAEVAHLARLARLDLTEDELDHYASQLDVILQSVARVSEVAGTGAGEDASDVGPFAGRPAVDLAGDPPRKPRDSL